MKSSVALLIVLVATVQAQLTLQQRARALGYASECIQQSGVDSNVVFGFRLGNFPENDPLARAYVRCFLQRLRFINEAGEFQVDYIKSVIPENNRERGSEVIDRCAEESGADLDDTIYRKFVCVRKESIGLF